MRARILAAFVLLAGFVLALVVLPLGLTYASRQQDRLLGDIERDARVLASLVEERLEEGDATSVARVVDDYEVRTGGRVVVTDALGRSIADSEPGVPTGRDYSTRPEIAAALNGTLGTGVRPSETVGSELAYAAVPVASGGSLRGAVRVTFDTDVLSQQVRANWLRLGLLSAFVLAAAGALGWIVSSWVLRPVRQLTTATDALAEGDLEARLDLDEGPPELVDLAGRFDTMAGRIEALVDSRDRFVADASHQLRTPLTAIRLRLDSLEEQVGDRPDADEEVQAIAAEIDRLSQLVANLLGLARATGDHLVVGPVDTDEVVTGAADRWRPLAAEQGVTITVDVASSATAAVVSGGLDQILDNLIDNALDVAPAGSTIDLSSRVDDPGRVTVEVRDHGRGLDAAACERAFDRFWRAPDATPGGSGIGLSVVAQLVERSGGTVRLLPAPSGPGLLARVVLPVWSAAPTAG